MNVRAVARTFKVCSPERPLSHPSKSPWFPEVLEKSGVRRKEKLRSDNPRKAADGRVRWHLRGKTVLAAPRESGASAPAPCRRRVPGSPSLSPAAARRQGRSLGRSRRPLPHRDGRPGSPHPPPSRRLGALRLDVRSRFPSAGLARSPSAGLPGHSEATPRPPGAPRTRGDAPTHVALQLPLGGRLDEPARAHGVARAHRAALPPAGPAPAAGGSRRRCRRGGPSACSPPALPAPPPRPRDPRPEGPGATSASGRKALRAGAGPPPPSPPPAVGRV